jgi:hypothetical protein
MYCTYAEHNYAECQSNLNTPTYLCDQMLEMGGEKGFQKKLTLEHHAEALQECVC